MSVPPDIEEYLVRVLAGQGAVKVWAYDSGTQVHAIEEVTAVQVDCRASSKERAEQVSQACRALILALPGQAWDAGVVHKVTDVMGPAWLPDEDGAPRYVFRCTLHYRSSREAVA